MSYLNNANKIEFILSHPADLVSATLRHVTIMNINCCINLKNLYSERNIYKKQDILSLHNL